MTKYVRQDLFDNFLKTTKINFFLKEIKGRVIGANPKHKKANFMSRLLSEIFSDLRIFLIEKIRQSQKA